MKPTRLLLFSLFFTFCVMTTAVAAEKPVVFVSIAPQQYFVEQISGDLLDVEVLVSPGASPHTYEPKPSQMKALASCAAYFAIGVTFEDIWLERIAAVNPNMMIVHTDDGIDKLPMTEHDHGDEAGDHFNPAAGHLHEHETGTDPHIWLAPNLVKQQTQTIATALEQLFPEHSADFRKNLARFVARIDDLDRQLHDTLADKSGLEFMVFHPSWGYFAAAYGLHQIAVELDGKNPKPAQLRALIEHAREHQIRVIFAQPQLSSKSAALIAREIDGQVVMIDPLAKDWLTNMTMVAERLHSALR